MIGHGTGPLRHLPFNMSLSYLEAFVINVGGVDFTTLKSTLKCSPMLAAMLSDEWTDRITRRNGVPFIDRDADVFKHILKFLRTSIPPVLWTRSNGFDLSLYAELLVEAEYFQLDALAEWIKTEQYIHTIQVITSTDTHTLEECRRGLRPYTGDMERNFGNSHVSTFSKSGKTETVWKQVHVRSTKLCLPVSQPVLVSNILGASADVSSLGELVIWWLRRQEEEVEVGVRQRKAGRLG